MKRWTASALECALTWPGAAGEVLGTGPKGSQPRPCVRPDHLRRAAAAPSLRGDTNSGVPEGLLHASGRRARRWRSRMAILRLSLLPGLMSPTSLGNLLQKQRDLRPNWGSQFQCAIACCRNKGSVVGVMWNPRIGVKFIASRLPAKPVRLKQPDRRRSSSGQS